MDIDTQFTLYIVILYWMIILFISPVYNYNWSKILKKLNVSSNMTNRENEELCAMNKQWFDIHLYVMKKKISLKTSKFIIHVHDFNDRVLNEVHVLSFKLLFRDYKLSILEKQDNLSRKKVRLYQFYNSYLLPYSYFYCLSTESNFKPVLWIHK